MLDFALGNLVPLVSRSYNYYTTTTYNDADTAAFGAAYFVGMCCYLIVLLAVYVFMAYCLMKMAENAGLGDKKIFAWIPFLNSYLLVLLAKKDIVWFLLMFIPFVNIVVLILVWVEIFKRFGKESWMVILLFIPIVNFVIIWQLANSKAVE